MKRFCVLYSNGLSGTWLTWFINQHTGFPTRLELDKEYSDPAFPDRITDYTTQPKWWYGVQAWEDFIAYVDRMDHPNGQEDIPGIRWGYDNLAFKVQPYHEFFGPGMNTTDAHAAARFVLAQSNCKQVIVPLADSVFFEPIYNRLVAIRPQMLIDKNPKNWYNKELYTHIEKEIGVPVLRLDIGKIFNIDDTEYEKLLEVLSVPALSNWKELVNDCVNEIYSNYK